MPYVWMWNVRHAMLRFRCHIIWVWRVCGYISYYAFTLCPTVMYTQHTLHDWHIRSSVESSCGQDVAVSIWAWARIDTKYVSVWGLETTCHRAADYWTHPQARSRISLCTRICYDWLLSNNKFVLPLWKIE